MKNVGKELSNYCLLLIRKLSLTFNGLRGWLRRGSEGGKVKWVRQMILFFRVGRVNYILMGLWWSEKKCFWLIFWKLINESDWKVLFSEKRWEIVVDVKQWNVKRNCTIFWHQWRIFELENSLVLSLDYESSTPVTSFLFNLSYSEFKAFLCYIIAVFSPKQSFSWKELEKSQKFSNKLQFSISSTVESTFW